MTKKLLKVLLSMLLLCLNVFDSMAGKEWIPVHNYDELYEQLKSQKSTDGNPRMVRLESNIIYKMDRVPYDINDWVPFAIIDDVILDLNGHTFGFAVNTRSQYSCKKQEIYDERGLYLILVAVGASLRIFDTSKDGNGQIIFDGPVIKADVSDGYCYKKNAYAQQYRNVILNGGTFELYGGSIIAGGTGYGVQLGDKESVCEGPAAASPDDEINTVTGNYMLHKFVNGSAVTIVGEDAVVNIYGGSLTANGFLLGNHDGKNQCYTRPCYCINDLATTLDFETKCESVDHPKYTQTKWYTGVQEITYSESCKFRGNDPYRDSTKCRNRINLYGGTYYGNCGASLSPVAVDNYDLNKTISLKYYPVNGKFIRNVIGGTNKMMLPPLHIGDADVITKEPQGVLAKHSKYYRWLDFSRLDHCDKKDAKYQAYQPQSYVKIKGNAEDYCRFKTLPFFFSVDNSDEAEKKIFHISGNATLSFTYDTLPALLKDMGYELTPYVKYYFSNNSKEITQNKETTLPYSTTMKDGYMICGLQLARRVHYADGRGIDSYQVLKTVEAKFNIVYDEVIIDPSTFTPEITKQPTDITTDVDSMDLTIAATNASRYKWYVIGESSDILFANTTSASYTETDPARIASLAGKKMYCSVNNGTNYVISDTFSVTCYVPTGISIPNYSFPYGKEKRTPEEDVKDLKVYYYSDGQELSECGLRVSEVSYVMFSKTIDLPLEVGDKVDIGLTILKDTGWVYKDGNVPSYVRIGNTLCNLWVTGPLESAGYWRACVTGVLIQPDPAGYPLTQIQYLNKTTLCDSIPFPNATDGGSTGGGPKQQFKRECVKVVSTTWYDNKHNVKTSKDTLVDGYYEEVIVLAPTEDYYYFVDTLAVNTKVDFLSLEKKEVTLARYYQVKDGVATQIDCVPFDVVASPNKKGYGAVSLTRNANHIRIAAIANEGYKLAYWEDSESNSIIATDSVYEADIVDDFELTAVFAPIVKSIVIKNVVAPKIGDTKEGALYAATVTTADGSYDTEIGGYWSDTLSDKETSAYFNMFVYLLSKVESLEEMSTKTNPYTVKADSICFVIMSSKIEGVDESTEVYVNDTKVGTVVNLYGQYLYAYAKFVSGGEITGVAEASVDPAFNAYLNSTNSTLYVDGVEGATLTISSILGVEVYKNANAAKLTEINVSNWANGVYLINVAENGLNKTIKFIKK